METKKLKNKTKNKQNKNKNKTKNTKISENQDLNDFSLETLAWSNYRRR